MESIDETSKEINDTQPTKPDDGAAEFETVDLCESERPYILTEAYYLFILLFIGIPMWFLTCSSPRYSVPEASLELTRPQWHLDISVVRMSNDRTTDGLDYLRSQLHNELGSLNASHFTYDIDWRVRRPTADEVRLAKSLLDKETGNKLMTFERGLNELHKQSYRFRLLMFVLDKPFCDTPDTYSFGSEPFVYLCPGEDGSSLINLIKLAMTNTYISSVDTHKVKRILSSKTNMQVTLIPEDDWTLESLSRLADNFHEIYQSNVKNRFVELPEIVNIRFTTQILFDLPQRLEGGRVEDFFRSFRARVDEPLEDDVHHVATLIPNETTKQKLANSSYLMETPDSHFVLRILDDDSITHGIRTIVRRIIGLSSPDLCDRCQVKRDVFLNKWELDVVVSALTTLKLNSIYTSLESLGKLKSIPKLVSTRAHKAYQNALKSLSSLGARKPLEAYRFASVGYDLAEKAYYDPSLVDSSNDFPEETKYAVYLPLFLPLVIPFSCSIYRVLKHAISGSRSAKKKVD